MGYVLKRAVLAAPFVLAALPLLFTVPGAALVAFQIGPWTLTITEPGLVRFISVALKSWLSVQMAIVLAATTAFPDLLGRDARRSAAAAARRGDRADVALPVRAGR